jgi:hypothetical protein
MADPKKEEQPKKDENPSREEKRDFGGDRETKTRGR